MLINTRPLGKTLQNRQGEGRREEAGHGRSKRVARVRCRGCVSTSNRCSSMRRRLASSITQINFENHSGTLHLIATKTLLPAACAAVVCNCCCSNSNYAIDRGSGCVSNPLDSAQTHPRPTPRGSSHKSSNIHFSLRMELFFAAAAAACVFLCVVFTPCPSLPPSPHQRD